MSIKISGLDKLQKQLYEAEKALQALDGNITNLHFDPNDPASLQAAIRQMENAIDQKTTPFRGNTVVQEIATQMKEKYKNQLTERAALARSQQGGKNVTSDELPSILRQIENTVSDLRWADVPSFGHHIKKLSHLLHNPQLEEITRKLAEGIDLEAWLRAGEATQGGMIGSARLQWPTDGKEELGIVILLIDRFAENPNDALNFSHTFYDAGGKYIDNTQPKYVNPFLG